MAHPPVVLQVSTLPDTPGVYQYYDKDGALLYIGKAKNLKKRVASYFNKTHENARTRMLVKRINDIKHIVVATETDALLLENNLIKKYQPKYNVLLKDDKIGEVDVPRVRKELVDALKNTQKQLKNH